MGNLTYTNLELMTTYESVPGTYLALLLQSKEPGDWPLEGRGSNLELGEPCPLRQIIICSSFSVLKMTKL